MTREEAIEILWQYDVDFEPHPAEKIMHAIDMAIEALEAMEEYARWSKTYEESTEEIRKALRSVTHGDLISRKAAIDEALTFFIEYLGGAFDEDNQRLLAQRMNSLPSAEPVDCTDFIRWIRDAVLDEENWELNAAANGEVIARKLKKLNAVFVEGGYYHSTEPVHGEWVLADTQDHADTDNGNYRYICSQCQHSDVHAKSQEVPYCWWCGAKMEGGDTE